MIRRSHEYIFSAPSRVHEAGSYNHQPGHWVQFMYINIEPVTVDNHKNGNFYNEMRECVCMSHMTQPGSTTSIPYPFVLPTILDSLSYYAITSPSKYIPFLYIPSISRIQDQIQIQIPLRCSIYNWNETKSPTSFYTQLSYTKTTFTPRTDSALRHRQSHEINAIIS